MSQVFASDDQNTGVSASVSVLPMSIQGWFPLRLLWSLCCPKDSQESSPAPQSEGIFSTLPFLTVQHSIVEYHHPVYYSLPSWSQTLFSLRQPKSLTQSNLKAKNLMTYIRFRCGSSCFGDLWTERQIIDTPSPTPEKAMAPHSSTLAWKVPWMEEPGGLQSMGSLRVGHDWATSLSLFTSMHWRRKWQPTPVFLPGESKGRGSLVGCCLWGCTESNTTEAT